MTKVSVIVPVFNIDKRLLIKCIDSLLNQTLKEIEIILVDDASTEQETIDVLQNYQLKYNNKITTLTHTINKKQGGARNSGLKISNGEFIGFCDADDYVDKNMYKLLYEKAIEDDADIVDCDLVHVDSNYKVIKREKSIINTDDFIHNTGRIVSKIFNKQLLLKNNIFFPENMFYESTIIIKGDNLNQTPN